MSYVLELFRLRTAEYLGRIMRKMIITDLKRNIFSTNYLISLIIFIICALINFKINVLDSYQGIYGTINIFLFSSQFGFNILQYIAPIIAVLATNFNYNNSRINGFLKQELMTNNRHFMLGKSVSAFMSSASVFFIGSLILYLMMFVYDPAPSIKPLSISEIGAFKEIYNNSLFLYSLVCIFASATFGGMYGVLSTSVSTFVKSKILVLLIPFLYYNISTVIIGSFGGGGMLYLVLPCMTYVHHFLLNTVVWLVDCLKVMVLSIVLSLIGFKKNRSDI